MTATYVSVEALAKYFSVSISTIRAWMRQGFIPADTYIKIGTTYRFHPEKVEAALVTKTQGEAVVVEEPDTQMDLPLEEEEAEEVTPTVDEDY